MKVRERLVAVTLDHETWQPVPHGKRISWTDDILDPTERLLDVCDATGAKLTIMAELGEYFWLQLHEAPVAALIEAQWQAALHRGHDVQLHLHLSWLPELGVSYDGRDWTWPREYLPAADYPGDLEALIARCVQTLRDALRGVRPDYRVSCFRAGAYQVQPFRRLHDALLANGIVCDTSVWAGGVSRERGYDFRLAWSDHQPYFASPWDAQLLAPPSEGRIVEIPVFTYERGRRWLLDGDEGPRLAHRLLEGGQLQPRAASTAGAPVRRALARALWARSEANGTAALNRIVPRSLANWIVREREPPPLSRDYFVLIGHSKGDLQLAGVADAFRQLRDRAQVRFATLSEMAASARADLAVPESKRERIGAAAGTGSHPYAVSQSGISGPLLATLGELVPWDRDLVLDVPGPGQVASAGTLGLGWSRVATLVDGEPAEWGAQRGRHAIRAAATALPLPSGAFDLACVRRTLERLRAPALAIAELHRVLRTGGALVAAIPSDARNPSQAQLEHAWKASPHEVELRLAAAGFVDIEIEERDGYRELGLAPHPAANDRIMLVRAWKRSAPVTALERALEIMGWVYGRLSPEKPQASNDVSEILSVGFAWCAGYNEVLARLLKREGFEVTWVTMEAENHPRGRGLRATDTHEVLEVSIDGKAHVLDAMTNRCQAFSIQELLARPELASPRATPDQRYRERRYELYDTREWYEKVTRYCLRAEPYRNPCVWRPVAR